MTDKFSYIDHKNIIHTPNPKENGKKIIIKTLKGVQEKLEKDRKETYQNLSKKLSEINKKFLEEKRIIDFSNFLRITKDHQKLLFFLKEECVR